MEDREVGQRVFSSAEAEVNDWQERQGEAKNEMR